MTEKTVEVPIPRVDTEIYAMSMFTTLEVTDLARSRDFWTQALDFVVLAEMPGPDGAPMLVHLRRWRYQDVLLVQAHEAVDAGRGQTVTVCAEAGELPALAERIAAEIK
ncbi:MAG TPA: VOC family protein, partial [Pseudonocardia sp.]|nr:VOC family protein [Pseudonocardia sp.]